MPHLGVYEANSPSLSMNIHTAKDLCEHTAEAVLDLCSLKRTNKLVEIVTPPPSLFDCSKLLPYILGNILKTNVNVAWQIQCHSFETNWITKSELKIITAKLRKRTIYPGAKVYVTKQKAKLVLLFSVRK